MNLNNVWHCKRTFSKEQADYLGPSELLDIRAQQDMFAELGDKLTLSIPHIVRVKKDIYGGDSKLSEQELDCLGFPRVEYSAIAYPLDETQLALDELRKSEDALELSNNFSKLMRLINKDFDVILQRLKSRQRTAVIKAPEHFFNDEIFKTWQQTDSEILNNDKGD